MKAAWSEAVATMPPLAAVVLLAFQFATPLFHLWQNHRPGRLGGPIARAKAAWLTLTITLWVLLPAFLAPQSAIYLALALSMLLRAVIELPLCARQRWKTGYGLGHDAFHLGLALICWPAAAPGVRLWLALTMVTVVAEIFFVLRFRRATAGPASGIYYVPDGPQHARLLLATDAIRMPVHFLMIAIFVAALFR